MSTTNGIKEQLEVKLRGGLLLGSGEAAGFHDVTLRDADGVPFIPAAALKGAIREQLLRLTDLARVERILGGPGPDFAGRPRSAEERPGGGATRVYLEDAVLQEETWLEFFKNGSGFASRHQVSISRRSGRAADQHLFQREIVAPWAENVRFIAGADLSHLDATDRSYFEAALRAVFAIGAGRSGGLGGVELSLRSAGETETNESVEIPTSESLWLELEALDPLCLGADRTLGNFHRTLPHVSASAMRGAVVTAALRKRGLADKDQSGESWFHKLILDSETCLRFGDAHPVEVESRQPLPMPAPVTLMTCKKAGFEHGVLDTLMRGYFQNLLAENGVFLAPEESCAECSGRLRFAKQPLWSTEPVKRVVTRLGLDNKSARGADGQLFSLEVLERGTRFRARIAGLDDAGRQLLADAAQAELRIGHGRGQGYGRARIVGAGETGAGDELPERLKAFDGTVRQGLESLAGQLGVSPTALGADQSHFSATLISDLMLADAQRPADEAFSLALGLNGVEIVHGQVRGGQRGGWDTQRGCPKIYSPILRAGSVVLLRTARPLDDLREHLVRLEARGAGEARDQGLGWLRFSDPIHSVHWRKP